MKNFICILVLIQISIISSCKSFKSQSNTQGSGGIADGNGGCLISYGPNRHQLLDFAINKREIFAKKGVKIKITPAMKEVGIDKVNLSKHSIFAKIQERLKLWENNSEIIVPWLKTIFLSPSFYFAPIKYTTIGNNCPKVNIGSEQSLIAMFIEPYGAPIISISQFNKLSLLIK